jgi:molecular chaperone DnaK
MAADNKTLGRFQLTNIPPAPRGVPQIEVTFDIDANGIVSVSAKDLGTGKSQSITIQSGSGLSEEDIQRMVKEAEENAEADKRRREEAELRNESEQAIYSVRKAISDLGAEVTDDEKKDIEAKVGALEEALKGGDLDRIRSLKDDLLKASQNIAVKAYQKTQAQQNQGDKSNTKAEDDVVDAEIVDE